MDKQLLSKQIEFYRKQIQNLKNTIRLKNKEYEEIEKDVKIIEKLRNQNNRLKEDANRFQLLLNQSFLLPGLKNKLVGKHYLGRPYKQFDFWYPDNLIGEVEHFLKVQQLGYGNKEFVNQLVKFIHKYNERTSKEVQKKANKLCSSRIKDIERKHNHSINVYDIRDSSMKRTQNLGYSLSRKTANMAFSRNLHDSKVYTESFICDKLQNSFLVNQGMKKLLPK